MPEARVSRPEALIRHPAPSGCPVSGERLCIPADEPVRETPRGAAPSAPAVYASRTELANGGRSQSAGRRTLRPRTGIRRELPWRGLGCLDEPALGAEESLGCEATVLMDSGAADHVASRAMLPKGAIDMSRPIKNFTAANGTKIKGEGQAAGPCADDAVGVARLARLGRLPLG